MTPTMIVFYIISLMVSPFIGVLTSYQLSKKHTHSSEIGGVMAMGAILSMSLVGIGFPAYYLLF